MMNFFINDVNKIPRISGLYFLFCENKLIYVGKAWDLSARLTENRLIKDFLKFGLPTRIFIIEIPHKENNLLALERELIKFLMPVANSMNLQKEFRHNYIRNHPYSWDSWTKSF